MISKVRNKQNTEVKEVAKRWFSQLTRDPMFVNWNSFNQTPVGIVGEFMWSIRYAFNKVAHANKCPEYDTLSEKEKVALGFRYIAEVAAAFEKYTKEESWPQE